MELLKMNQNHLDNILQGFFGLLKSWQINWGNLEQNNILFKKATSLSSHTSFISLSHPATYTKRVEKGEQPITLRKLGQTHIYIGENNSTY